MRLLKSKKLLPRTSWEKFLAVLAVVVVYAVVSIWRIGFKNGLAVTFLTWSAFVMGTPIADAGFLLDFPVRLITGIRMVYSEIVVWIVAILGNVLFLKFAPWVYDKAVISSMFKTVLLNPWPLWLIILLSAVGTFMSLILADDFLDREFLKKEKPHKLHFVWRMVMYAGFWAVAVFLYYFLIENWHIKF